MRSTKTFLFGIALLASLIWGMCPIPAQSQNRDLMGGADLVLQRPPNPQVRKRKNTEKLNSNSRSLQSEKKDQQPEKNDQANVAKPEAVPQSANSTADEVEDALALGNAARDRQPPDLSSAERAYRLAWKINPNDPRPHVGLGNVYLDQEKFPEAAKAYREAIRLGMPRSPALASLRGSGMMGNRVSPSSSPQELADWRVFAATSYIRQNALLSAERELTAAVSKDPKDARARALLGYDLFTQQRFTEAALFYNEALHLEPSNATYRMGYEESSKKAAAAATMSDDFFKSLEGTSWELRDSANSQPISTCDLKPNELLKCTPSPIDKFLFTNRRWKLHDGFMKIEAYPPGDSFCVGRRDGTSLRFTCLFGDEEKVQVWTRRQRN